MRHRALPFRDRHLDRRQLLAATSAGLGAWALSACGTDRPATSTGEFTALYEGAGTAETLDPGVGTMFIDEARWKHLFDGLFEIDSTMAPVPRLATAAEANADGTVWRMRLRETDWHDGSPFVADDVLYTFSRILGKQTETKPFAAAGSLGVIDLRSSRALDAHTVEIALNRPSFTFPSLLTSYGARIVKDGTTDFRKPIGTGPFRFESFSPGRAFVATANPDYWSGAPEVDTLRIIGAAEEARVSALRSGQADFIDNVPPAAVRTLTGADGITVGSAPDSGILYFAMKTAQPPFDNPDVRRAMMLMIDREELVKVALEGDGEVSDDIFGRGFQYYADDLQPHTYDPDAARGLLRKAGAADLAFELYVAPVSHGFVEAAQLVKRQAAEIGVRVTVATGSPDTYYTEALSRGDMTMGQSGPLSVPIHFSTRLLGSASKNYTQWDDPEFQRLYEASERTSSETERTRTYHRMHEILHDRGGFIFWATSPWQTAVRGDWKGLPQGVPNALDWARFDKVVPA